MKNKKFRINPVLHKELKVKMRGWKSPILILVYNIILGLIALGLMRIMIAEGDQSRAFITVFIVIACVQFALIGILTPVITSSAIAGEREKQTLDILLSTDMRCISIILGKLWASLSHILLLVISSLPIVSIVFIYGGVTWLNLLQLMFYYIVATIFVGSIGIFFSTVLKKSIGATIATYAVALFFYFGTVFIQGIYMAINVIPKANLSQSMPKFNLGLIYLSPAAGFGSLMAEQLGFYDMIPYQLRSSFNFWWITALISVGVAIIFILLSAYKLNPKNKKITKKKIKKNKAVA